VSNVDINGILFVPAELTRVNNEDQLRMTTANVTAPESFKADEKFVSHVTLKDGRVLDLPLTVAPSRPKVTLLSKNVERSSSAVISPIRLTDADELPQGGRLSFFLRAETPDTFSHAEKIEVATADNAFHVQLSESDGSLTLQDLHTMRVVFDPAKSFGAGAFGPVRYRPISAEGVAGDWQPLTTLVRVPVLTDLRCPAAHDKPCTLSGSNLFLLDSVAADQGFKQMVAVPEGFVDATLDVPRPTGGSLYIKLRDDPSAINEASLDELTMGAEQEKASTRHP
jgi:hypothetical protein